MSVPVIEHGEEEKKGIQYTTMLITYELWSLFRKDLLLVVFYRVRSGNGSTTFPKKQISRARQIIHLLWLTVIIKHYLFLYIQQLLSACPNTLDLVSRFCYLRSKSLIIDINTCKLQITLQFKKRFICFSPKGLASVHSRVVPAFRKTAWEH